MGWIRRKNIIQFDVDDTLVTGHSSFKEGRIPITDHRGFTWWCDVHWRNVALIGAAKKAGFSVTVHSKGGMEWAESVLLALEVPESFVDEVADKPHAIVDDLDSGHWIQFRLWAGPNEPRKGSNGLQAIQTIDELIRALIDNGDLPEGWNGS